VLETGEGSGGTALWKCNEQKNVVTVVAGRRWREKKWKASGYDARSERCTKNDSKK